MKSIGKGEGRLWEGRVRGPPGFAVLVMHLTVDGPSVPISLTFPLTWVEKGGVLDASFHE